MENIQAKQKKKKGFTLIELIIVIAILGILALIAIPKFSATQRESKIKADIATGKTVADITAKYLANGEIKEDQKNNDNSYNEQNSQKIMELINNDVQGGEAKVQAIPGARFGVSVDKKDEIVVYVVKSDSEQIKIYPDHDKYPDGTAETP
ncbi:type II secretion system protein [Clostridium novyi]|uniref:type II secretion system protein n=1 Tax=Clostridium novyi TaxID=1542 RepID=UPI0005802951|nr:type II secretion system protein [Clostridium novyi]